MENVPKTTCPNAKPIDHEHIRGCGPRVNRTATPNGASVYYPPCTEACYNGDYTKCPFYRAPKEAS